MEHDELLDAINKQIIIAPPFALGGYTKFLQGLNAVVELHKPVVQNEGYIEIGEEPILTCECDPWNEYDHGYPCPTIQAIEKELI